MEKAPIYLHLSVPLNNLLRSHAESLGVTRQAFIRQLLEASLVGVQQKTDK